MYSYGFLHFIKKYILINNKYTKKKTDLCIYVKVPTYIVVNICIYSGDDKCTSSCQGDYIFANVPLSSLEKILNTPLTWCANNIICTNYI